jgi:hypothetical protein
MMSREFSGLIGWVATYRFGIALVSLLATTSGGVAEPVALIENRIGRSAPAEVMTYVDTGQTIRLGSQETIVLSYLHSCIRETITGGIVTVGIDQSEVRGGSITRTKLDCSEGMFPE